MPLYGDIAGCRTLAGAPAGRTVHTLRVNTSRVADFARYWPALLDDHVEMRERVLDRYNEEGRAYHDLRHLSEVFERIDVLLESLPRVGIDRDALLLAGWFHDAVYDTEGDNEERSAMLAERELATASVPALLIEEVARLVRLTADHRPGDADRAGQVLCDADLGILAADRKRYDEYAADVRREYAALPETTFREGRMAVLRRLLDAPTLFSTPHARQRWEEPARENVNRELGSLRTTSGEGGLT